MYIYATRNLTQNHTETVTPISIYINIRYNYTLIYVQTKYIHLEAKAFIISHSVDYELFSTFENISVYHALFCSFRCISHVT